MLSAWIGLRYQRSKNQQGFLSLLSWVSLLGMMLGIAALIVVLSVMNGFQSEIKQRILFVIPHVIISGDKPIDDYPALKQHLLQYDEITAVSPWVGGDAMIASSNQLLAVTLNGINIDAEKRITNLPNILTAGNLQAFNDQPFGIILGSGLAYQLGVQVGQKITVTFPKMLVTPFGIKPRTKQFVVMGVFEAGADVDATDAFIRLSDAQKLSGIKGQVEALRVNTQDIFDVNTLYRSLQKDPLIQDRQLSIATWEMSRSELFSAIKMEKVMVMLMLTLIIAVAAFNLISMMSMMVSQKRNDIAVLRMMGMQPFTVLRLFLVQGLSLAMISLVFGCFIGVFLAWYLADLIAAIEQLFGFYIFDPNVFYITGLPSELQWNDVLYVIVLTLVLSTLFILYPAYRATKIKPIEALQYQ